ncbi:MAG: GAP family protein [Candidatus Doudnabacteria bacterium]|nr:GAP family protein [Candidatus Doudnabacteria bacterium]
MKQYKPLITWFLVLGILIAAVVWFKEANIATQLIWQASNQGQWLLPLVSVAALIDSINPCAFSVLLLTIAFLLSLGKLRGNILQIGSAYIIGLFLVYVLIGLGLLQALHIFNIPHFMGKLGAVLLIGLGLINVLQELFPKFPIKLGIPHSAHHTMARLAHKASIPTALILGAFVGLCEFPCTGGPYLMILGLLHDQATYLKGFSYLIFYNLIFVLPLVIILVIASRKEVLEKVQNWQQSEKKNMRLIIGGIMVILGLLIFLL